MNTSNVTTYTPFSTTSISLKGLRGLKLLEAVGIRIIVKPSHNTSTFDTTNVTTSTEHPALAGFEIPEPNVSDYIDLALMLVIFIFGGIVNTLVLKKLTVTYRQRTRSKHLFDLKTAFLFLKVQLTITNLFVCVVVAPWRALWLITYEWYGGTFLCKLAHFLFLFAFMLSSNMIAAISLDRARIVMVMIRANRPDGNVTRVTDHCMQWVYAYTVIAYVSAIACSSLQWPIFVVVKPLESIDWQQCASVWMDADETNDRPLFFTINTYQMFHLVVTFWAPFIVIVCCYTLIGVQLTSYSQRSYTSVPKEDNKPSKEQLSRLNATFKEALQTDPVTDVRPTVTFAPTVIGGENSSIADNNNDGAPVPPRARPRAHSIVPAWRSQMKSRTFTTAAAVIGCYILFFLPYNTLALVTVLEDMTNGGRQISNFIDDYLYIVKMMIFVNSAVNPFIYGRGGED